MTGSPSGGGMPGTTLVKIARWLFNEQLVETIVQPTISDFQREVADAGPNRLERLGAHWRGYRAFWRVVVVCSLATSSWRASAATDAGAVAFPDAIARLAVGSIVVALLAIAGPMLGAWVVVVVAVGAPCAFALHAWYDRHPSDIPTPDPPQRRPQINFSSTEVAGNVGGLIFAVGSVFIVSIAVPSLIWFLLAAAVAGGFLAWGLVAWRTRHPHLGAPENRIVLR